MLFATLGEVFRLFRAKAFRRQFLLSLPLALALLVAALALSMLAIDRFGPEESRSPQHFADFFGISGISVLLVTSMVLMTPVAAVFAGLSAGPVASVTEDQRWSMRVPDPGPPPLKDVVNFTGLLVGANLLTILLILTLVGLGWTLALLIWPVLNGALLGREYFTLIARRHLGEAELARLRQQHFGQIWLAGFAMALFLSLPVLNLAVPFLGLSWFTLIFHRLRA